MNAEYYLTHKISPPGLSDQEDVVCQAIRQVYQRSAIIPGGQAIQELCRQQIEYLMEKSSPA